MNQTPLRPCVLVADDDGNLRKILSLFLRNAGYETLEAKSGREAVDAVRLRRPEVVIMDVMMPLLDGFTACRMIKDDPTTRDTSVVMCTARNRKEDLVAALKAGAEDYIIKPFTKDTVLSKVAKVLTARQARASRPKKTPNRRAPRKRADWSVSWTPKTSIGLAPVYRTKVLDISLSGLSFEFSRCGVCTGYEQGTVHPQCLFARHARRFPTSEPLDFVLALDRDTVIEVQGKIAHVLQSDETPLTEKVGVVFTDIAPHVRQIIQEYIDRTAS